MEASPKGDTRCFQIKGGSKQDSTQGDCIANVSKEIHGDRLGEEEIEMNKREKRHCLHCREGSVMIKIELLIRGQRFA